MSVVKRWRKRILILLVIILVSFGVFLYKENTTIGVTQLEINSSKLPQSFNGFTIVQLSDIHDSKFGENNFQLVNEVKAQFPDAIFITGDFIDRNRYNLEQSLEIIKQLQFVAPLYYVTGNHEISSNDVDHIKTELTQLGVHVLSDESLVIEKTPTEKIAIGGIEDPLSSTMVERDFVKEAIDRTFADVPEEMFKLLLSHRPEQFEVYVDRKIDLVFSGHAHGGQFRLPGVGGIVAPGQGWFPKYTSGIHEMNESQMIVSRGLGNSIVPIRVFNQPEIVVATLIADSTE